MAGTIIPEQTVHLLEILHHLRRSIENYLLTASRFCVLRCNWTHFSIYRLEVCELRRIVEFALIGRGNKFLIVVLKQEMTTREYMENQDAEEPDDFIISLTAQVS